MRQPSHGGDQRDQHDVHFCLDVAHANQQLRDYHMHQPLPGLGGSTSSIEYSRRILQPVECRNID